MKFHNIMEEVVYESLDRQKVNLKLFCDCPQCINDIMAIALNNLRPHYVVKSENLPYARVPHLTDRQSSTNVLAAVTAAAKTVSQNPRCENKPT